MRILLSFIALILVSTSITAQGNKIAKANDLWDELLGKYVTPGGFVNYEGFKSDKDFQKCLNFYASEVPNDQWTREAQMAYWMNVYNAFTVRLITDHYPLKSIKDIDEPWKKKFIKLDGEAYSLDQIEHEILRPIFKDPRIHFGINCASFSCPVLPNKAHRAETLDETLDHLTREFLNDIHRNRISGRKAAVSQLFEWFAEDFEAAGGVRAFIEQYRGKIDPKLELSYITYNWNLNTQP